MRWARTVQRREVHGWSTARAQYHIIIAGTGYAGVHKTFRHQNKGFVVSVGGRRGVVDMAGDTIGGQLAHTLKDAIAWEYQQSVTHPRG